MSAVFVLSHPTGNTFVRAAAAAFRDAGLLAWFETTIGFTWRDGEDQLRPRLKRELGRRRYALPRHQLRTHPVRESVRLLAQRAGLSFLTRHEIGWASPDAVYRDLDRRTANALASRCRAWSVTGVYCYEDGAFETFQTAKALGLRRVYDLPIAYWETSQRLLREEAERWPEWEPTLGATRDSAAKLERKSREFALADVIICPSQFVRDSLPPDTVATKHCAIVPFGSPRVSEASRQEDMKRPLRVLFAGGLSQRKGLADVFAAFRRLRRADVELVLMGTAIAPLDFYRRQGVSFRYEPPRPHEQVIELMQTCDVLVLPSIVEGRALVQQEALACGLPIIVTANAGGADLVDEGQTGFLVPIRDVDSLADRIAYMCDHRALLPEMRAAARRKAAACSWEKYRASLLEAATRAA